MAIIERPQQTPELAAVGSAATVVPSKAFGIFQRPVESRGWKSWLFTIDHKKLGIMYGFAAFAFFIAGGIEAILIRLQLFQPNGKVLSAQLYNEMFTTHATTMVFLFVMPMAAAFGNYFLPLQIGARDVAFPRLNAFGFWCFLFGGLFFYLAPFLDQFPDGGWFAYAPNTGPVFSPSHGMDFWGLALQITGIASLTGSINLIVTVLNMRAPGMTLTKMPVFTWMILVIQFLLVFAIPVITVALVLLTAQRRFGATFFDPAEGADPLLWQHLFWIFGHPEVYILILPSFGIVSEVLPTFSRKPLFGYRFVVFSGAAIGFMGWGVWAHHMFASGLGPISVAVFSATTMFIAVPTGVKIINWIGTMWGGRLWLTIAMKFAIALIVLFTIGGLSGVTHSISPSDTQQTDTYYIVAHFHYVLFGGAIMGIFSGFYYWWPKMFGRMLDEKLGNWNFWLMVIGTNLTFGPMHIVGLQGQPRRMYQYEPNLGFDFWNKVETIGSLVIALGVLMFIINAIKTNGLFGGKPRTAPLDPWDARSYEWFTASPPKEHNFDTIIPVHHLDEFFMQKYAEDADGNLVKVKSAEQLLAEQEANADKHIHMPSPSYWPIVLAFGLPVVALGLIYNLLITFVGALIIVAACYGWAVEPSVADDDDADPTPGSSKELVHV
jgi:cytochrome c oxidase subunit I